jgi:NADH:ubiquinone oxidoreductase subunit E/ferredoxin/Pyruvate/2-oxoacid:ferredoxin oxidoreductase delta subunit
MDILRLQVDGKEVEAFEGMTILQAAEKAGINIPTLCHHKDFIPTGACRVCVVELEGSGRLLGSCHTPVSNGMILRTRSPKVLRSRKATIELLLAAHTGPCVMDSRAAQCGLHKMASDLEVGPPRFSVTRPRFYPIEEAGPYIRRDLSKCILCSRCITACNDLAGKRVFSAGYRSFNSKVIVDNDIPLNKEVCKECYLCVEFCPTAALSKVRNPADKKRGRKMASVSPQPRVQDTRCGNLLPMLKKAQKKSRHVSSEFMAKAAESLDVSISDVFGVATFYNFLSTKPLGVNVIRVCKNLPCCMKGSETILKSIEDTIGIKPGGVTRDKKFSLELVNCIGACDHAPAMLINDEVFGNLTPRKISKIMGQF